MWEEMRLVNNKKQAPSPPPFRPLSAVHPPLSRAASAQLRVERAASASATGRSGYDSAIEMAIQKRQYIATPLSMSETDPGIQNSQRHAVISWQNAIDTKKHTSLAQIKQQVHAECISERQNLIYTINELQKTVEAQQKISQNAAQRHATLVASMNEQIVKLNIKVDELEHRNAHQKQTLQKSHELALESLKKEVLHEANVTMQQMQVNHSLAIVSLRKHYEAARSDMHISLEERASASEKQRTSYENKLQELRIQLNGSQARADELLQQHHNDQLAWEQLLQNIGVARCEKENEEKSSMSMPLNATMTQNNAKSQSVSSYIEFWHQLIKQNPEHQSITAPIVHTGYELAERIQKQAVSVINSLRFECDQSTYLQTQLRKEYSIIENENKVLVARNHSLIAHIGLVKQEYIARSGDQQRICELHLIEVAESRLQLKAAEKKLTFQQRRMERLVDSLQQNEFSSQEKENNVLMLRSLTERMQLRLAAIIGEVSQLQALRHDDLDRLSAINTQNQHFQAILKHAVRVIEYKFDVLLAQSQTSQNSCKCANYAEFHAKQQLIDAELLRMAAERKAYEIQGIKIFDAKCSCQLDSSIVTTSVCPEQKPNVITTNFISILEPTQMKSIESDLNVLRTVSDQISADFRSS